MIRPIHYLDERILQNVFSQLAVAQTALEASEERTVILDRGC